jgi:hypothetical protein
MTRVKKLLAIAGTWVVLSSGVGCGLCDCLTGHDDGYSSASSYTRDVPPQQMPPPQMPQARQPADITTGANVASAPGIYPDNTRK